MTQLERIFELLPPRLRVLRVDIHLEADPAGLLAPRRHGDCKSLATCEDTWIAWHGEKQATCPARCPKYQRGGGATS